MPKWTKRKEQKWKRGPSCASFYNRALWLKLWTSKLRNGDPVAVVKIICKLCSTEPVPQNKNRQIKYCADADPADIFRVNLAKTLKIGTQKVKKVPIGTRSLKQGPFSHQCIRKNICPSGVITCFCCCILDQKFWACVKPLLSRAMPVI